MTHHDDLTEARAEVVNYVNKIWELGKDRGAANLAAELRLLIDLGNYQGVLRACNKAINAIEDPPK